MFLTSCLRNIVQAHEIFVLGDQCKWTYSVFVIYKPYLIVNMENMNPETKRWMLDKYCQPQTWQLAWDENRKMPEWDDLSEDYKRFIQIQLAYPGEASAKEWWESRFQRQKREYFEIQDVNDDKKLGERISNLIHVGDVSSLDALVRENPQLDLSKFPGSWDGKKMTPIVLAATLKEMEVFTFLLKCKVKLEVVMRMPKMNFDTNLRVIFPRVHFSKNF